MTISSIINHLSNEESALFTAYLKKKNKRYDTKNLELYSLLRKKTPLKEIDIKLYGKPNRNAYYAVSKRLQDSVIDFIATRGFETENSEDMHVLKYILASRILYEREVPKAAQKLLKKATTLAKDLDLYTALVEIYHTKLQYAHLHPELNLEELTQEAQKNQERFLQQEHLNLAYAHLKRTLIFTEDSLSNTLQESITATFTRFNIDLSQQLSFKSLFQLMEILNRSAQVTSDFNTIQPLIVRLYKQVVSRTSVQEKHRFYHIQVLYFMANAHFRNRQFERCREFLALMYAQLLEDRGRYADRFSQSYLLLHTLHLNYTGEGEKAISIINERISKRKKTSENPDLLFSLAVFYTQQEDHRAALTTLNKLKHSDSWYEEREGMDWVIRRDLLELIIHFELENTSLVESFLRRFKRKYTTIIKKEARLAHFIKMYERMFNEVDIVKEDRFRDLARTEWYSRAGSAKTLFPTQDRGKEDLFMLSYFAWIKAKIIKQPLYETTLELL